MLETINLKIRWLVSPFSYHNVAIPDLKCTELYYFSKTIFKFTNHSHLKNPNEQATRKHLIDQKLVEAGWDVENPSEVVQEFHIPKVEQTGGVQEPIVPYGKNRFADYILKSRDGHPLAVVEAKRTSVDAEAGEEQAKRYAIRIQAQYQCDLPFCFYTNGLDYFFWDVDHNPPRKIYGFPTCDDLERLAYLRKHKRSLSSELIDTAIAGRAYQLRAIKNVLEGIEQQRRNFLLVMATGTGKTRTAVAMIDALVKSGWVSRVLFLVDRIELQSQALDAFKEHTPNLSLWPRAGDNQMETHRKVYVSTYPTMLNVIQAKDNPLSAHFFDFIVVDESHRSIYNVYQNILNYFDAITLGLTATPTDYIDHNTFQLFQCQNEMPTFAYTYEEAVQHRPPYLNNYNVLQLVTNFQHKGIRKETINFTDQQKLFQEGRDVDEVNYEGSELEKTVSNKGTNVLIVKQFMEHCIKDADGVLPGKTIFFCMGKAHARRMKRAFDELYPEHKGELARVIVSGDSEVSGKGGLIDQFKTKDWPRIAISVDMLDTGIDVREIVNLVFAKPVFSVTKFWQMIGRGSRVLDPTKLRSWCPQKDSFLILDCWQNFQYFKMNPEPPQPPTQIPLPVQLFRARLQKAVAAQQQGLNELYRTEVNKLKELLDSLPPRSVTVLDAAAILQRTADQYFWETLTPQSIAFLERDVAPIMRALSGANFKAMRFERDVVLVAWHRLMNDAPALRTGVELIQNQVGDLATSLEQVQAKMEWIEKAQTNSFWHAASHPEMQQIIDELAPLMHLRTGGGNSLQDLLNLKDKVVTLETVEYGPEKAATSITRYREMVEAHILALAQSNLLLQRIRTGENISPDEEEQLATLLADEEPHITKALLGQVYKNRKASFLQFIRHILGLEVVHSFEETVNENFDLFIAQNQHYTAKQLTFLEMLRDFILEKESINKHQLTAAPFTGIHRDGILGLFADKDIDEILTLTQRLGA